MAPYGGLTHSLPLLGKIFQWFMSDHLKVEGFLFHLHQKVTSFLVLVGLLFITIENFLDSRSIVCKENSNAYSKQFCWMHGYSYIEPHLQGKVTGCYVDQTALKTAADAPVTNYYLWLPYMLGLLFIITKLPHILWKKFFETNLLRHIIGGEESWPEMFIGPKNNGGGDGGNNNDGKGKGGDNNKNNGNGDGGGKKKKGGGGGGGKRFKVIKNTEVAINFARNHKKFNLYHLKYAFWETFNIVAILASIQITDWVLNGQFWSYGLEVINYLDIYQSRSQKLHDPMCQVFPTEVSCRIITASHSGPEEEQNHLCILGNNLFNQKYFFALWVWWMAMLGISCLGILFRVLRIVSPSFSKMLLLRKVHGSQLNGIIMSSGECFVLELVIDNLSNTPVFTDSVLTEVAVSMKEVSYRRSTSENYKSFIFNYHDDVEGSTPLLREEKYHNLESTKLSPILPETKFKFESQHVKSKEPVLSHETNVKKSLETDQEAPGASCKNTDSAGGNDEVKTLNEEDTLIDLQEVAKPTSKKKKNKKNQKVTTNDSEDKNLPSNADKKNPEPATAGGSLMVMEVEKVEDSTVVSFQDSHLSQDWL